MSDRFHGMTASIRAGFGPAGAPGSRLGHDKAALDLAPSWFEQIAGRVRQAAGIVTLLAPSYRCSHVGIPTVAAIVDKRFKMQEFVSNFDRRIWPAPDPGMFRGIYTPEAWRLATEVR